MKRIIAILLAVTIWAISIGAERNEPLQNDGHIDFEAAGFQKMYTTAYILEGTTADGGYTRPYICASSLDHIGDIALVYTLEGNYLGAYLCTDTGREGGGVRAGRVLDIWRKNMTQATSYMKVVGPEQKVYVLWIEGDG